MGKLLGLFLFLLAVGTAILFLGGWWWFPESISEYGPLIDAQFNRTLVVVGVAFCAAQIALGYAIIRFGRKGNERAVYTHGSSKLELTWTVITAVVFVALAILGQRVWAQFHLDETPPNAKKVEVVAQQFQWNFHYPGPDGALGRTDRKLINDSALDFVGIDRSDPAAQDDAELTTLAIPVNQPVELTLRSKDVIHSFFVPALRIKQDAVPGLAVRMNFTASRIGKYELTCAELCGNLHHNMKSFMLVLPDNEYNELMALPSDDFVVRMGELLQRY
ncbi:MAG: cytochrome c oxidase subunit II [Blastocatellia bacterium]|nr:cytochrome c oxidase subunit II [Blastocatellia bacterium]